MKILYFVGGLGNQMFEYAFYLYMREHYPTERFYGLYNKKKLAEHYSLEIDKWFDVELPESKWYSDIVAYVVYFVKHIFNINRFYDGGIYEIEHKDAIVHFAFKYSNKFFVEGLADLLRFNVNEEALTNENKEYLNLIRISNSVYIHVRRGDYLSPKYRKAYEGTCPLSYYEASIYDIKTKLEHPHFFVFSDDMKWTIENLPLKSEQVTYVTGNTGENSPLDMYLMANCKYAIMANSTFSYWAAILGNIKDYVYYPKKWINNSNGQPNIFYNEWIAM